MRPAEFFTALIDTNGNEVVQYWYDAWGNHKVVDANGNEITSLNHLGNLNPFRYRGYYYDVETGLYFLQTRYYDPEVGRFLNRDSVSYADPQTINGLNLYTYCGNNPVEYVDPTGHFPIWLAALAIGTFVSSLISGTTNAVQTAINGGNSTEIWASFAENAITGAAMGFAMTFGGIAAIYFGAAAAFVSVIVSVGYNPAPLAKASRHVHIVGDALKVGNLRTVVWRAWEVAEKI